MKIIAHRGASGLAPENTIAAMELAIKQGCHGIETDLQLTKDGEVVVFHDWSVERTTNGLGEIKDLTLSQILELDAGSWFSEEFKGEKIPTLVDLLNIVPKGLLLNLEIKSQSHDDRGIEEKVVRILEKYNRIENIIISSFNHMCLERVQKINKQIKLGILYEAHFIDPLNFIKSNQLDIYSIHSCSHYTNKDLIQTAHDNNMKVYSWTVNDIKIAERLEEYQIDGIITNYPNLLG